LEKSEIYIKQQGFMAKMVSLRDVITFILAMVFVIQLFSAGGEGSLLAENTVLHVIIDVHRLTIRSCACSLATCLSVPSWTYGNKEECPCYNNWTTQEGNPKFP